MLQLQFTFVIRPTYTRNTRGPYMEEYFHETFQSILKQSDGAKQHYGPWKTVNFGKYFFFLATLHYGRAVSRPFN